MKSLIPRCAVRQCRHFSTSYQLYRRPNIQSPLVPGTERRILDAITVPIFPPDRRSPPQKCLEELHTKKEKRKSELMEAFDAFRIREAQKMFEDHKLVAICHALPLGSREFQALRATVVTAGFQLVFVRNDLALAAVQQSRFVNLSPYMTSRTAYVISQQVDVPALVKLLRKAPSLALMGGVFEEQILSRDMILQAAKLPPLDVMRGELLTILSTSASKTSQLLSRHPQNLSSNLDQLLQQEEQSVELGAQRSQSVELGAQGEENSPAEPENGELR